MYNLISHLSKAVFDRDAHYDHFVCCNPMIWLLQTIWRPVPGLRNEGARSYNVEGLVIHALLMAT